MDKQSFKKYFGFLGPYLAHKGSALVMAYYMTEYLQFEWTSCVPISTPNLERLNNLRLLKKCIDASIPEKLRAILHTSKFQKRMHEVFNIKFFICNGISRFRKIKMQTPGADTKLFYPKRPSIAFLNIVPKFVTSESILCDRISTMGNFQFRFNSGTN